MTKPEHDYASLAWLREDVKPLHSRSCHTPKTSDLVAHADDAETLVFFGVTDIESETWSQSAAAIVDLCSQKLSVNVLPNDIKRAHRIGKCNREKNRPIMVQFSSFRTKDSILSKGSRFKSTQYSMGEDFSLTVRQVQRHLLTFARAQSFPFTLRYNRLKIGNKVFFFDPITESVKQCSP